MINFKNVLVSCCAAVVLLVPVAVQAQTAPFKKGEIIRFSVKQMGVKAGEATLEFKGETYREGKKYTLIVFTAKGFNFYDEERIFVDGETFFPQIVIRDLNIFGGREQIMEEYDHVAGTIKITKMLEGHEPTSVIIEKKAQVDNIYGFIYRYRMQEKLTKDEKFDVRLPTLDVKISGVKDVEFNAAGKMYKAVLLTSVPSKYSIWMDKSEKRLPLRIGGAIGIANTVMTMIEYNE
jgi:hypothetical protein